MKLIKTATLNLPEVPLRPADIAEFRRWVIGTQDTPDALFHNHRPDGGYLHRYPLVQYRTWRGHAQLWGLEAGAAALQRWAETLEDHPTELITRSSPLAQTDELRPYALRHWLGLNAENYRAYLALRDPAEQQSLLEGTLTGHLLGFCTTLDYRLPPRSLRVTLTHCDDRSFRRQTTGTGDWWKLAFDLAFTTNLRLPPGIALGKGISKGFGLVLDHVPDRLLTNPLTLKQ